MNVLIIVAIILAIIAVAMLILAFTIWRANNTWKWTAVVIGALAAVGAVICFIFGFRKPKQVVQKTEITQDGTFVHQSTWPYGPPYGYVQGTAYPRSPMMTL